MRLVFAAAVAGFALTPPPPASGLLSKEPVIAGVRAFYGPSAGIETVDTRLIDEARTSIDMTAYVLSDRAVVSALGRAAMRGVHVRVYLDGEQMGHSQSAVAAISATPNVELRQKHRSRDLMHLKSFVVDRRILRSGSANFSVSAEEYQDNDLIVIESPDLARSFEENFERLWARGDNQRIGAR
jgi:phosphatidylserine/phosphatidylglycerophosphate/cardiolipin synthase-like enzyme